MTPCLACARHVKHDETACPFCGAPFAAPPPRNHRIVGRVTRAAIFSAALVACSKHDEPKPTPKPGSAEHLDQDFNQLLGSAEPGSGTAPGDAAVALAPDATIDAGLSDEERTRQLQQAQEQKDRQRHADDERRRREIEEQRLRQQQIQQDQIQQHYNAKPYGAPPARRRVV
ncbi:MAG: hypothetical protein JO257_01150 [Deltaproteobacteria bacterium]|nr:hypothetical protein [Deltaproteobacteria bacterium]